MSKISNFKLLWLPAPTPVINGCCGAPPRSDLADAQKSKMIWDNLFLISTEFRWFSAVFEPFEAMVVLRDFFFHEATFFFGEKKSFGIRKKKSGDFYVILDFSPSSIQTRFSKISGSFPK